MERITMSIDESLPREFDQLIHDRGYASRSEAMRDLLRREVEAHRKARAQRTQCVANFSYVYNHHERKLSERHDQLNLVTVKVGDRHFTLGSHRHAGLLHLIPRS
ncbi:MAG: nickel-responsive transcriptional regulator NikR [Betaproteobacteria bacterium]